MQFGKKKRERERERERESEEKNEYLVQRANEERRAKIEERRTKNEERRRVTGNAQEGQTDELPTSPRGLFLFLYLSLRLIYI